MSIVEEEISFGLWTSNLALRPWHVHRHSPSEGCYIQSKFYHNQNPSLYL